MFELLVLAVFIHQLSTRLMAKADAFPLRGVLVRFIEFLGKVFIIPGMVLYFGILFPTAGSPAFRALLATLCFVWMGVVISRESVGLKGIYAHAMLSIRNKVNNPTQCTLTRIEMVTFNIYYFNKCSRSAAHYHRWKREYEQDIIKGGTSTTTTDIDTDVMNNMDNGVELNDVNGGMKIPRRSTISQEAVNSPMIGLNNTYNTNTVNMNMENTNVNRRNSNFSEL